MGNILNFIAKETSGNAFTSYKYCYDSSQQPRIEYDSSESSYINLKDYAEDVHDPNTRDLYGISEKMKNEKPLFSFFLDGSRKVYKIDDIKYDKKVYPILSGQISVACCGRKMSEDAKFLSFKKEDSEYYSVICLPVTANCKGIEHNLFFNQLLAKINEKFSVGGYTKMKLNKLLYYLTKIEGKETLENKGIARIQDEMIECEKRIVARMVSKHLLDQDHYLIKDGSIQYKPMKNGSSNEISRIKNNYRHVIGVSKSFNPNIMKDNKNQSNAAVIANLKPYHRTPAFLWQPGEQWGNMKFAIWYVRIRPFIYTSTPYSGIVKVEKMLITEQEENDGLGTDEIDYISANLINERNPVCYGNDQRWANHLYPVYMTESFCKSCFINDYSFINLF